MRAEGENMILIRFRCIFSIKYLSSENTYHHRITDMNTLVSFLPLTIVTFGEEPPKPKGYTARNAYTHSNSDPARGYSV